MLLGELFYSRSKILHSHVILVGLVGKGQLSLRVKSSMQAKTRALVESLKSPEVISGTLKVSFYIKLNLIFCLIWLVGVFIPGTSCSKHIAKIQRLTLSVNSLFVYLVGFLKSSSPTRLYRGRVPRLTSDNFTCCHTRLDHNFCLRRSHHTDTDLTSRERALFCLFSWFLNVLVNY